jgi:hypothetical protein
MEIVKTIIVFLHVLTWPTVVLVFLILFREPLNEMLRRLRHADLPGGLSVDLEGDIQQAKAVSQEVTKERLKDAKTKKPSIPLTEANARMIEIGLKPSPSGLDMNYYKTLAGQDPTLALAGLRIEIDILAKNLAAGFKVPVRATESGSSLLGKLADSGAITRSQFELSQRVLQLCNLAIHGQVVSKEQADEILKIADALSSQFISWLSWGFKENRQPTDKKKG